MPALEEILERLEIGRVNAGGEAHWSDADGPQEEEFILVPRDWWRLAEPGTGLRDHSLWRTGRVTFNTPGEHGETPVKVLSMRFAPPGIYAIIDQDPPGVRTLNSDSPGASGNTPTSNKNAPSDDRSPITTVEFDAWYAEQSSDVQGLGGKRIREKAIQDHGGRVVVRKLVDAITKGRRTGRKPGSRNAPSETRRGVS